MYIAGAYYRSIDLFSGIHVSIPGAGNMHRGTNSCQIPRGEYTAALKQFGNLLTSTDAANERLVAYKTLWDSSFDEEQQKWLMAFLDGWRLRRKYRGKEAIIQVVRQFGTVSSIPDISSSKEISVI